MENNNDNKTSHVVIPHVDEFRAIIQAKLNLAILDCTVEEIETVTVNSSEINDNDHSESQTDNNALPERIENVVAAMQAAGYTDTAAVLKTAQEIIQGEPEIDFRDLFDGVHYLLVKVPLKAANGVKSKLLSGLWALDEEPKETKAPSAQPQGALPTLADIEMPKVSEKRLRHDLASEAEQMFFQGTLPYSQALALVGIIDYVKRQGVVIGSDKEVYQWLYHMVSNNDFYYSNAVNFKHWCNIAMSQLRQRRLHRPAGFGKWLALVEKQKVEAVA